MKILAADPISDKCAAELKKLGDLSQGQEALETSLADTEILIVRSKTKVTKELIDTAKNLKLIIRAGVGLDNIDLDYAKTKGIKVENTPTAPSIAVAELTIGLIFSMLRNISKADASVKKKEWLKKELRGRELYKKTIGIIGLGRIGGKVAKLANALEANVLVHDPYASDKELKESNAKKAELEELLKNADIITLHVPLNESTKGMISTKEFSLMKEGAYIVNTSRGPVVDEQALCEALKSGKLAGAALDVFWKEPPFDSNIMELKDKLVLTPHIGSATYESQDRIGELVIEKVKEFLGK